MKLCCRPNRQTLVCFITQASVQVSMQSRTSNKPKAGRKSIIYLFLCLKKHKSSVSNVKLWKNDRQKED